MVLVMWEVRMNVRVCKWMYDVISSVRVNKVRDSMQETRDCVCDISVDDKYKN